MGATAGRCRFTLNFTSDWLKHSLCRVLDSKYDCCKIRWLLATILLPESQLKLYTLCSMKTMLYFVESTIHFNFTSLLTTRKVLTPFGLFVIVYIYFLVFYFQLFIWIFVNQKKIQTCCLGDLIEIYGYTSIIYHF